MRNIIQVDYVTILIRSYCRSKANKSSSISIISKNLLVTKIVFLLEPRSQFRLHYRFALSVTQFLLPRIYDPIIPRVKSHFESPINRRAFFLLPFYQRDIRAFLTRDITVDSPPRPFQLIRIPYSLARKSFVVAHRSLRPPHTPTPHKNPEIPQILRRMSLHSFPRQSEQELAQVFGIDSPRKFTNVCEFFFCSFFFNLFYGAGNGGGS